MNKTYATILALVLAAGLAGVLVYFIFSGGSTGRLAPPIAIIGVAVLVMVIGAVGYFARSGLSGAPPETAERKRKAAAWVTISALATQLPAFFTWISGEHKNGEGAVVIGAISAVAFAAVIGAIVSSQGRRHAPAQNKASTVPWVVPLIIGMVVLGVGGIIFAMLQAPHQGKASDMSMLLVVLAIMIVVLVFVVRIFAVASRFSAYALPDVLPEAGPPTDAHFSHGGYYDGTRLLNQRVWGIPVPVTGRGYFMQGQGKVWLADEVIAIHLYLTRKPIVIPYGIIHSINTKKLILRKNHFPGPGMSIIWGRPDMPMVTTIQVTQHKAENELWAQEITRRANMWKEKMAAAQTAAGT